LKYYLFIDESGDHGLSSINRDFPLFLLCGVIISSEEYEKIRTSINEVKQEFWGGKKVIFHSRDIRKCEKEFVILFDLEKKKRFYEEINNIISSHDYTVVISAINKEKYIKRFGKLSDDVYEISLSFIIERSIFFLDDIKERKKELEIVIEKRGKSEDKKLDEHFQRLLSKGTGYVDPERLKAYNMKIKFKRKIENINGLQLADLIAYPSARYVIDPERANPAFDLIIAKIYKKDDKLYGLKIYP
jgi:hypothetical protein